MTAGAATERDGAREPESYVGRLRLILSVLLTATLLGGAVLSDIVAGLAAESLIDDTLEASARQAALTARHWRDGVTRQLALIAATAPVSGSANAAAMQDYVRSMRSLSDDATLVVTDGAGRILADRTNAYGVGNDLPGLLAEQIFHGRWRFAREIPSGGGTPWHVVLEVPVADLTHGHEDRSAVLTGVVGPEGVSAEGMALPPGLSLENLVADALEERSSLDGEWMVYRTPIARDGWHVVQVVRRDSAYRAVVWIHVATAVGAVISVGGLLVFLPRVLKRLDDIIREVRQALTALTQGQFSQQMEEKGDEDLAGLARSINRLSAVLETSLGEVEYSAQLVSASAEEILTSAEAQEETANRQSSSLNQTAATAEEMNLSAQQAAANAEEVVLKTEEASQQILSLSEKAQQISQVTEFIDEISHQIRIMALNASIESAKAGGRGGGFAVIASEIRQLADDARNSTGEIETLVQDMQEATSTSVMTMEQTVESVKVIGLAMNEQSVATSHVTEAMVNMNNTMSQTVSNTRTTVASGEDLNRLAFELRQAINRVSGREVLSFEEYMGRAMGAQEAYYGDYAAGDYAADTYTEAPMQEEAGYPQGLYDGA